MRTAIALVAAAVIVSAAPCAMALEVTTARDGRDTVTPFQINARARPGVIQPWASFFIIGVGFKVRAPRDRQSQDSPFLASGPKNLAGLAIPKKVARVRLASADALTAGAVVSFEQMCRRYDRDYRNGHGDYESICHFIL